MVQGWFGRSVVKPLRDMQAIQIEITNACIHQCSNCTRFCGHHPRPYMMSFDDFRRAVDSLDGFNGIVGVMGGEPLLHPEFARLCEYLHSRVPPQRCGLWSTFPKHREHHASLIARVFGNLLLNDHTRPDIRHLPLLVAPRTHLPDRDLWYAIHHCLIQNKWSAAITPKGAYFCEVAAAMDMLVGVNCGWPVEPGWWNRCPSHYREQVETFCVNCGGCLAATGRLDTEEVDDVCPAWLQKLQQIGSPRIAAGKYRLFAGKLFESREQFNEFREDDDYARRVAAKYGLSLVLQPNGYLRPVLDASKEKGNENTADLREPPARADGNNSGPG